jgi:hypothetical protein
MNAVHNARITLLANLLNAMAGSSFTVGVAAPIAAAIFYKPAGLSVEWLGIGVTIWICVALGLHIGAQQVLGRLLP